MKQAEAAGRADGPGISGKKLSIKMNPNFPYISQIVVFSIIQSIYINLSYNTSNMSSNESGADFSQVMSPVVAPNNLKIEILKGSSQYKLWSRQIEILLRRTGLDIVLKEDALSLENFKDIDEEAKVTVASYVSPDICETVLACTTTKEALKELAEQFTTERETSILTISDELKRCTIENFGGVEDFITNRKRLYKKMSQLGIEIDERVQVVLTLDTLPPSYDIAKEYIAASESFTWDTMRRRLSLVHKPRGADPLLAVTARPQFKPRRPQERRCFFCKQEGHIKAKCTKYKSYLTQQLKMMNEEASVSSIVNATEPVMSNVSGNNKRHQWLVDSGSAHHITNDRSDLQNLRTSSEYGIQCANGSKYYTTAVGDCSLKVDGSQVMYLSNVLYVPEISEKIISLAKLTNDGYSTTFSSGKCVITAKDNSVIATKQDRGIFVISASNNFDPCTAIPDTEHCRNGHLGQTQNCKSCAIYKRGICSHGKEKGTRCSSANDRVHADIIGPTPVPSWGGARYVLVLTDDYSRHTRVYLLKQKSASEVHTALVNYAWRAKLETGNNLRCLKSDNGGEFKNGLVQNWCLQNDIVHEFSTPYLHQQNGFAERQNRTLQEMMLAMLHHAGAPLEIWAEAMMAAATVKNRTIKVMENKTALHLWLGREVASGHLRVWGCAAYPGKPHELRRKWSTKAHEGIFVGYATGNQGYRIYIPNDDRIVISKSVTFDESHFPFKTKTPEPIDERPQCEITLPVAPSQYPQKRKVDVEEPFDSPVENPKYIERSTTSPGRGTIEVLVNAAMDAELTIREALSGEESTQWQNACQEELNSMIHNQVYELTELPPGKTAIGTRWVLTMKENQDGSAKHKARLVAQGYRQKAGIDYTETFAPVISFTSVRLVLALSAQFKLQVHQLDVTTAFLYGNIEEEVYVKQPPEFTDNTTRVWKLNRSLYGLKQSPLCWNKELHATITGLGFKRSNEDLGLYTKQGRSGIMLLGVYVDDFLLAGNSADEIEAVKKALADKYRIKDLGLASRFLSLEIEQEEGSIKITHRRYIDKLLERESMEDCYAVSTPIIKGFTNVEDTSPRLTNNTPYRSLVGGLMYSMHTNRPDIAYAVGYLSRYLDCPTKNKYEAAKRVLRYLKGTRDSSIVYEHRETPECVAYCDSSYGGDYERASTWGYVLFYGGGPVSWRSRKHKTKVTSTTESEFVAMSECAKELAWTTNVFEDIELQLQQPRLVIKEDNQPAIAMAEKLAMRHKTKHIDMKRRYIQDAVDSGKVKIEYITTKNQIADIFTKALPEVTHRELCVKMLTLEGR